MIAFNFTTMDGSLQLEWNDGTFVLMVTEIDGSSSRITLETDDVDDFIELAAKFIAKHTPGHEYGDY